MEVNEPGINEIRTKDAGEILGVNNTMASDFACRGLIKKTRRGWVDKESVLKFKEEIEERRKIAPPKWLNPIYY